MTVASKKTTRTRTTKAPTTIEENVVQEQQLSDAFLIEETPEEVATEQLPNNAFQHEILAHVCRQKTNGEKIEALRKYRNDALVSLLIWNYDDSVITMLPAGDVPYARVDEQTSGNDTLSGAIQKQLKAGDKTNEYFSKAKTSLRKEYHIFYNFLKGGNDSLPNIRRETMFINLLEGLHPLEAELLILVKDKRMTDKYNLPWGLIREAYSDITWGGRS